ncbi:pilus assembly protein TadG-related protein [Streptomyces roseirectus]|uniref:pilus assembly protein TadG-related protein n=1 Tax=Streptomyces roseirectus TaxID=2768066 RepID=UPI001FECE97B
MAGLLFLAFAYLSVGQAGANRGDAQAAADAAALAAAQETRDKLAAAWVADILDPTKWNDIFEGKPWTDECGRARQLAAANDARLVGPECVWDGMGYTVYVRTDKAVGDSLVPGTEDTHSTAQASSVIEPLCSFDPLPSPTPSTLPEPEPTPSEGSGEEPPPVVQLPVLTCDGVRWTLDPDDIAGLPEPQDLFDVHLVD